MAMGLVMPAMMMTMVTGSPMKLTIVLWLQTLIKMTLTAMESGMPVMR